MSDAPPVADGDPARPPSAYTPLAPDPFAGVERFDSPAAPPPNTAAPQGFYFFYYAALACLVPFMSLYYQEKGLNGTQIGILAGTIPLVTWFSAPFWGGIADARKRHRAVLLLAVAGLWAAVLALYFARNFSGMLATVVLYAFFVGPIVPLVDNAVLTLLGDNKSGYGRVRLWGSIGWGLASSLLGPILERAGLSWSFYGFLGFMAVNFVVATRLPMRITAEGTRPAYRAGLGVLARNGRFLLLLLSSLVFGMTLGVLLSYQFLFLDELGAGRALMAWSLTTSTLSEIPFWFVSAALLRRFGTSRMIAFALAVATLRNLAMGALVNPWWALPINLLHGPSFAVLWAAGVADADAAAPPGLGATAQGLFSGMMFGLGSALGGFLGGPAYEAIGFAALFRLLGWISLGMLLLFVAVRLRPRRPTATSPS
ncbi:MAG: MFS transporter [Candidatus Promineofilum sp.]|nr:MFS transporter [Promineifilum sp.]